METKHYKAITVPILALCIVFSGAATAAIANSQLQIFLIGHYFTPGRNGNLQGLCHQRAVSGYGGCQYPKGTFRWIVTLRSQID